MPGVRQRRAEASYSQSTLPFYSLRFCSWRCIAGIRTTQRLSTWWLRFWQLRSRTKCQRRPLQVLPTLLQLATCVLAGCTRPRFTCSGGGTQQPCGSPCHVTRAARQEARNLIASQAPCRLGMERQCTAARVEAAIRNEATKGSRCRLAEGDDELCHDTRDSKSLPKNGQVQLRAHARAS